MDTMGDKINAREQMVKAGVQSPRIVVKFTSEEAHCSCQKKLAILSCLRHQQVVVEKKKGIHKRLKEAEKTWSQPLRQHQ